MWCLMLQTEQTTYQVYVGNLATSVTEAALRGLFAHCGNVVASRISGYLTAQIPRLMIYLGL